MTDQQRKERLATLTAQAANMDSVPAGLSLQITKLKTELGLIKCNDDDGCLSCGS